MRYRRKVCLLKNQVAGYAALPPDVRKVSDFPREFTPKPLREAQPRGD